MNKQEILEAIDATINCNNEKAITGDSLANILREMTNASGEGSGDGALKILVPDNMIGLSFFDLETEPPAEDFVPGTFSQSNWDIMRQAFESEMESMPAEYQEMYQEVFTNLDIKIPQMLAYNAEVYNILLEKLDKQEGTMLLLDQSLMATESLKMMIGILGAEYGIEDDNIQMSSSIPAIYTGINSVLLGMELGVDKIICFNTIGQGIDILGMGEDPIYTEDTMFLLYPDGSIVNMGGNIVYPDYIYVPKSDGVLTSDQKTHNNNIRSTTDALNNIKYIKLVTSSGSIDQGNSDNSSYSSFIAGPKIVSMMYNKFTYFEGLEYKQAELISSEESVNVTVLGTLNSPS